MGLRRLGFVVVLAGTALAAGCGSSGPSSSSTTSAPPSTSSPSRHASTTTTAPSSTTTSSGPPPVYEVHTSTIKGLGPVLVDGQGFTLYLFEPDKDSGHSTCYGQCADAWPPLRLPNGISAPVAGPGTKSSLLGMTKRTDGSSQVTYNGWPLYLWINDSTPGEATGQALDNLGGLWYVVSPDGKAIKKKA
jgi:predicted lipoprotein with Yx(FWY)xxD motif